MSNDLLILGLALVLMITFVRMSRALWTGRIGRVPGGDVVRRSEQPRAFWTQLAPAAFGFTFCAASLVLLFTMPDSGTIAIVIVGIAGYLMAFASLAIWLVKGLASGVLETAGHAYRRADEPLNYWYMALIGGLPFVVLAALLVLHIR